MTESTQDGQADGMEFADRDEPENVKRARERLGLPVPKREVTVELETDLAASVSELLDDAADRAGIPVPEALEHAILYTYGPTSNRGSAEPV
ncbi:hypothetical protein [Luteipulveratus mongoliensis]|uniref:Uncharacterized protein n=1 Tax=Luteipulveratus mongoliensis TaxID=571913 RepID=A0A0K1JH68_9MICO|nr:hypothetical protein [Luteipulveratus mongoliensis]AKU16046.1 hypothetical protein VV02_09560 [Luteipulveratus mongoliensis]